MLQSASRRHCGTAIRPQAGGVAQKQQTRWLREEAGQFSTKLDPKQRPAACLQAALLRQTLEHASLHRPLDRAFSAIPRQSSVPWPQKPSPCLPLALARRALQCAKALPQVCFLCAPTSSPRRGSEGPGRRYPSGWMPCPRWGPLVESCCAAKTCYFAARLCRCFLLNPRPCKNNLRTGGQIYARVVTRSQTRGQPLTHRQP